MTTAAIPASVRRAAAKFRPQRAQYYRYLGRMLASTGGATPLLTILQRDAQRRAGTPRGDVTEFWIERFANNGGRLADTWQGTLPDDDVTLIRIAEAAGGSALASALDDAARSAELQDKISAEVRKTLGMAVLAMLIGVSMSTVFVMFTADQLLDMYSMIPLDQWGAGGRSYVEYGRAVRDWGAAAAFVAVALIWLFFWSFGNFVGPVRDFGDRHVFFYRAFRSLKGAVFLSTMAFLTKQRSGGAFTLTQSMDLYLSSVQSKWMRWRLTEILDRMRSTGAMKVDVFETSLIDPEIFYYLSDVEESLGFGQAFAETGRYVETIVLDSIFTQIARIRWVLLIIALAMTLNVLVWFMSVPYEMKTVTMLHFSR